MNWELSEYFPIQKHMRFSQSPRDGSTYLLVVQLRHGTLLRRGVEQYTVCSKLHLSPLLKQLKEMFNLCK